MSEIDELRSLFGELWELMVAHGVRNWTRGIEGICYDLWDDPTADDLKNIERGYSSMYQGVGGFGDFYIPGNQRVDEILIRIKQVFPLALTAAVSASDCVAALEFRPDGTAEPFRSESNLLQYSSMPIYWSYWSDRRSE